MGIWEIEISFAISPVLAFELWGQHAVSEEVVHLLIRKRLEAHPNRLPELLVHLAAAGEEGEILAHGRVEIVLAKERHSDRFDLLGDSACGLVLSSAE